MEVQNVMETYDIIKGSLRDLMRDPHAFALKVIWSQTLQNSTLLLLEYELNLINSVLT